ncbi:golgin-45 [Bradysia coprophila]|uniref:golgin-45 n=1 Tax=Bradysia coprophila TaxID=38358 RepID=UPI00187D7D75|nr:golgin-45 [Bradysia coprophila]
MSGSTSDENARTRWPGDGMENNETRPSESQTVIRTSVGTISNPRPAHPNPGQNILYRPTDAHSPLPPIKPKGKIFNLVPRLIVSNKQFSLKTKEPRFIPFEPYKGAVNPIIPLKHPKKIRNRNNLDLNTLVAHMSDMKAIDLNPKSTEATSNNSIITPKEFEELKKERDSLAVQLKSQVQVNAELKNLLVAAVGEDLQTRVNVLTEDKLQLARALLSSAMNLSSHTEQIEYLAGQSEVWRSKFLASSLMVEELARWKASLMQKNKNLSDSNRQMLETMSTLREMSAETLGYLKFLAQIKSLNLPSSSVLDVSAECLAISQQMILHSGIGMPVAVDLTGLDPMTPAEKSAIEALQISNEPLMATDDAFRAVVGQAFSSFRPIESRSDQTTYNSSEESKN